MHSLELLGQPDTLVDCSDVIPVPAPFKGQAVFPATFSRRDIQQAVRSLYLLMAKQRADCRPVQCLLEPFPTLQTLPGPETSVPPV